MNLIKINSVFGVTLLILLLPLSACNVFEKTKLKATTEIQTPKKLPLTEAKKEQSSNSPFTGDVLFQLLSAEIAIKKGYISYALDNYTSVANILDHAEIAKRAVDIAIDTEDENAIEQTTKRWLELDPENPEASKSLGRFYLNNNQKQATKYLYDFYNKSENKNEALRTLADLALKNHDSSTSLLVLDDLIHKHPKNEYLLFAKSKYQYQQKAYKQALVSINKAIEINKNYIDAYIIKSALLSILEDKKVIPFLQKTIKKHPKSLKLRLTILKFLLEKKQTKLMSTHLKVAYDLSIHNTQNVFSLALLALEGGQYDLAKVYLKRVIHLGEYINSANYYLGRISSIERKHEVALEYYKLVSEGAHHLEAKAREIETLMLLNKMDLALKHISILRENYTIKTQKRLELDMLEAELRRELGDFEGSYNLLNKASILFPDNVNLLYAKALSADRINKHHEFEEDLKKILKKQPDNAFALNALGYYLVSKTNRIDEAENLILKAYKNDPDDAAILDSVGWLNFKKGNLTEAIRWLKQAHEKQFDPEISAHTGEVYWLLDNKQKAKNIWKKAIEHFPNDIELQETLKRYKVNFE